MSPRKTFKVGCHHVDEQSHGNFECIRVLEASQNVSISLGLLSSFFVLPDTDHPHGDSRVMTSITLKDFNCLHQACHTYTRKATCKILVVSIYFNSL